MNNINLKEGVKISPFMEDVIKEVARRHPDWVISSSAPEEARRFTMYHKDNTNLVLGHINEDYKYSNGERRRLFLICLLYTSPSPRDRTRSRMPSSA